MVKQLEKNAASFFKKEHASNIPTGPKGIASINNIDVSIYFPNAIEEFEALIEESKN